MEAYVVEGPLLADIGLIICNNDVNYICTYPYIAFFDLARSSALQSELLDFHLLDVCNLVRL